jgi:hypothetical protein
VHYGQLYVLSGQEAPEPAECLAGQRNGLCGAAVAGVLFLNTGLHTGRVGFSVELHDTRPPVDEAWEEIVEASFQPAGEASLTCWGGQESWPLGLAAGGYRARYCGTGMDEGDAEDTRLDGDPQFDRYLLQFWPAPPGPDAVVKQTSEAAAYWHEFAREQPSARPPGGGAGPED